MIQRLHLYTAIACLVFFILPLAANNVFVLPDGTVNSTVEVFSGNSLSQVGSFVTGGGATVGVTSTPSGSRYTTLTGTTLEAATTTDETFTVLSRSGQWNGAGTAAAMTPDGKYLLLLSGVLRIHDAETGAEVAALSTGSVPIDLAVSIDSSYVVVLSSISRRLYKVDLTTFTQVGTLDLSGQATGISVAPNGHFYATTTNQVVAVDGDSMTRIGAISISGTPAKMYVTPDGNFGMSTNMTPQTNASVWVFDLATNTLRSKANTLYQFGITPILMDPNIQVVSNTRMLVSSAQVNTIYEVPIPVASMVPYAISGGGQPAVKAIVKSGEYPEAKYLYYAVGQNLRRVSLVTDSLDAPVAVISNETVGLAYQGPSSSEAATDSILYNDGQTIAEGGTFEPIIIRALDSNGLPIFGSAVEFTSIAGVQITDAMTMTNKDGLARAKVNPGSVMGAIPVDVSVGGVFLARFALAVGDVGGGGGEGFAGISIVSGQGQLFGETFTSVSQPLVVEVRDETGTPIANEAVLWSIMSGNGFLATTTTITNEDGLASNQCQVAVPFTESWDQNVIKAQWGEFFVEFYVTGYPDVSGGSQQPGPEVQIVTPDLNHRAISGNNGQVLERAIVVTVAATTKNDRGQPIPNIALEATTGLLPEEGQWAQCEGGGGVALTDATGTAVCDLRIGGQLGKASLSVTAGGAGYVSFPGFSITILPGVPATVATVQGNNQTGQPGEELPIPLVAEVRDDGGNFLPGEAAAWEVLTAGGAVLSNVQTTTDAAGRVSATATLGNTLGPVQVRVTAGGVSGTFTFNVVAAVAELRKISGDNQVAVTGAPFANPIVVQIVDDNGQGVAGLVVPFTVNSGPAILSAASATTDSNGFAQVSVTAGSSPGNVQIAVSTSGLTTVTFSLTVRVPGPGVTVASFVNGASGQPGLVSGSIAGIYAPGLAPNMQNCVVAQSPGALPIQLADLTVQFGPDSAPLWAPIFHVCNINGMEFAAIQVPFGLAAGTTSATVRIGGASTVVDNIPVLDVQPGIFETTGTNSLRHGVIMRPNGSYVSPSNPALRGETLCLFATGLGTITPNGLTNAGGQGQEVNANLLIGINNEGVRVIAAEYAVNLIGVYAVYFELPTDTTTGSAQPLALAVVLDTGQLIFGNGSTIAIQ